MAKYKQKNCNILQEDLNLSCNDTNRKIVLYITWTDRKNIKI